MKRARVSGAIALVAGLATHASPIAAQASVGVDLSLYSGYVWRGLSLTNRPVAQPDLYFSFPAGNASVTVGGWANIDLGTYDDADDISQSGGVSSFNLSEFDPYAEISVPAGKVTLTGGIIGYLYPNDDPGVTSESNTWEVYGKAGLDGPLTPEIGVYYDFDKVNGAYVEGTVSHALPVSETLSLELGGLAAFTVGQDFDPDSDDIANFADDGVTHLDFSAGLPIPAGTFSITPALHLQINLDDATKITGEDESDVLLWGGVSIGWGKVLGTAAEADE